MPIAEQVVAVLDGKVSAAEVIGRFDVALGQGRVARPRLTRLPRGRRRARDRPRRRVRLRLRSPTGARLEWWVLGDDHWHVPARVALACVNASIDNTPVARDVAFVCPAATSRGASAAVATGNGAVIVAECENRGSIPVAVGVALVEPRRRRRSRRHPGDPHAPLARPIRPTHRARCPTSPRSAAAGRRWRARARRSARTIRRSTTRCKPRVSACCCIVGWAVGKARPRQSRPRWPTRSRCSDHDDKPSALRRAARAQAARKGLPLVGVAATPHRRPMRSRVLGDAPVAAETVARSATARRRRHGPIVDCLPGFDPTWRGRSDRHRGLPTNHGHVVLRGALARRRPALLWEIEPKGATLTRARP